MTSKVTVQKGDNLTKIVKRKYGFSNNTDIMNTVNLIKQQNKLKNVNVLKVGQELELPEQLKLNNVTVFEQNGDKQVLKSKEKNYYRATDVFGDIGNAQRNQPFIPSTLNNITKSTIGYVEDVIVNVKGFFTDEKSRDLRMADIFAKQIGKWSNGEKEVSGCFALEQTDAYKFALSVNADDWTTRQTEFKGKQEEHAYFDTTKSDNNVTLFSTEVAEEGGKEYIAMKDADGNVHYFDKSNNLSEVTEKEVLDKLQQKTTSVQEQ